MASTPNAPLVIVAAMMALLSISPSVAQTCDGMLLAVDADERRCMQPGAGERFKDCADCSEMVVVPAGGFTMGSPANEPEREAAREDQAQVTIAKPFAIGAFAITRREFAAFVAATGYTLRLLVLDRDHLGGALRPLMAIGWLCAG